MRSHPSLVDLQQSLRSFSDERDWSQFHTPRNLLLALAGEVGELTSVLQWVNDDAVPRWLEDEGHLLQVEEEIADVLAYLLQFADSVGVDPVGALGRKIEVNRRNYPVGLSMGKADKQPGKSAVSTGDAD